MTTQKSDIQKELRKNINDFARSLLIKVDQYCLKLLTDEQFKSDKEQMMKDFEEEILDLFKRTAHGCVLAKAENGTICSWLNNGHECDIWIASRNHIIDQTHKNIEEKFR